MSTYAYRQAAGIRQALLDRRELALIDGTIDVILNHRLDDLAAATLRAMTEAVSRPPSDVISHPQPFDIITKENM